MADSSKDYYQILGVAPNATPEAIKAAKREKVRTHTTDFGQTSLSLDEFKIKTELMQDINAAWEVLGDPDKRAGYDRLREQQAREAEAQQAARHEQARRARSDDRGDLFGDLLRGSNNAFWDSLTSGGFGQTSTVKPPSKDDFFLLPQNDIGLLQALIEAYQSRTDGKWKVGRPEDDQRKNMPEAFYTVSRQDGDVQVYRRVDDWKFSIYRDEDIKIRDAEKPWQVGQTVEKTNLLGEYYLTGKGRDSLYNVNVPFDFYSYLVALKTIARKVATRTTRPEGTYDFAEEIAVINSYSRYAPNTSLEGTHVFPDYEIVKKVTFANFWIDLEAARKLVKQTEPKVTVEGQKAASSESSNPKSGATGEDLG